MSRDMNIACMDCQEYLWVGQNDSFYSGEPNTMNALNKFLVAHRTDYAPRGYGDNYHELVYIAEPYNEYIKDFHEQVWKEWEADDFKADGPEAKQQVSDLVATDHKPQIKVLSNPQSDPKRKANT